MEEGWEEIIQQATGSDYMGIQRKKGPISFGPLITQYSEYLLGESTALDESAAKEDLSQFKRSEVNFESNSFILP